MKKDLWLRLKNYHFDHIVPPQMLDHVAAIFGGPDASTKAFASKLARKLRWSPDFAYKAIIEYKKFVFLGNVGGISVTPSKVIDQVWHEHLLFSRAYREFCRDVLGRDFDHNPELVPTDDQTEVFQAQYLETLDAYRAEFNREPPADIWSIPKFKAVAVKTDDIAPKKRGSSRPDRWADNTPLFMYFDGGGASTGGSSHTDPEFGGGGGFSGGGSSRSWGSDDAADTSAHADSASAGHGHGGDSGGSGDGGGSGCSSSCGGGCGS